MNTCSPFLFSLSLSGLDVSDSSSQLKHFARLSKNYEREQKVKKKSTARAHNIFIFITHCFECLELGQLIAECVVEVGTCVRALFDDDVQLEPNTLVSSVKNNKINNIKADWLSDVWWWSGWVYLLDAFDSHKHTSPHRTPAKARILEREEFQSSCVAAQLTCWASFKLFFSFIMIPS